MRGTIGPTMRAVHLVRGEVVVRVAQMPHPATAELLVAVSGAGVNGADMLQWNASAGSPDARPGLEFAGTVAAAGGAVTRFRVGDRVMGILEGGGQAGFVAVDERVAMPVPAGLDPVDAGALPEIFTTAYDALAMQADVRPGDRVLVHGAAGGVGGAAVQIAKALGGHVTATVRNAAHRERVTCLGADRVCAPERFGDHGPYDVILELVGAPNFPANIESLAARGRIVVVGVGAGDVVSLSLRALMTKRAVLRASMLRTRSAEEKAVLAQCVEREVLPRLLDGTFSLPIAQRFSLEDASRAYDAFRAGGKFGKIVLAV